MKHAWSILCSRVIIDKQTNMLSLIDTVDAVDINGELPPVDAEKPALLSPIQLQLVSYWYRSDMEIPEIAKVRNVLIAPDEQVIGKFEVEIQLEESTLSRHVLAALPGIPFKGLGYYRIRIEKMVQGGSDWSIEALLPLLLRFKPAKGS